MEPGPASLEPGDANLNLRGPRELKVVLPARLYVRLRGMKLLTGQTIAGMVCEALDAYFERPQQRALEPELARMLPVEANEAVAAAREP